MAAMTPGAARRGSWLTRARRGLALLCCLLTLTLGLPEAAPGAWAAFGPLPAETGEGEERAPNDENDEGKDNEQGQRGEEGHGRARRPQRGGPSGAPLAHRPHDHDAPSGHCLPVCSPFERGALLPLRC
jgi:hypothetical protein